LESKSDEYVKELFFEEFLAKKIESKQAALTFRDFESPAILNLTRALQS